MTDDVLEWSCLHKQLQDIMKQELKMLRDVWGAMKEEEEALLQRNLVSKKIIKSKRCFLNKQLKIIQKERSNLTKSLVTTLNKDFYIHHFNSKNFNLLISQDEENSVETFHLRDQILHLMKNIKQLKDRIATLMEHAEDSPCLSLEALPSSKQENFSKKIQTINTDDPSSEL